MTKAEKREYDKKYRADNPEYDKIRHKKYRIANLEQVTIKDKIRKYEAYKKNPKKFKLRHKTWAENNPEKTKNRRLRRLYGITIEEYNQMFKEQNGVCVICLNPETGKIKGKPKALAVDHNHITGKVRQLLCESCNKAIGLLKDSQLLAQNVTNYLIKWNI